MTPLQMWMTAEAAVIDEHDTPIYRDVAATLGAVTPLVWNKVTDGPPCTHTDDHWTCVAEGCGRLNCRRCDGIPGDEFLCWDCTGTEDPEVAG